MIGSLNTGNMNDSDNEGHGGWRIDQVESTGVDNIVAYQPNLVLINVGTNDAAQNHDISGAGDRMIQLLDKVFSAVPNTTIILSTLLPNKNAATEAKAVDISHQFRDQVMNNYANSAYKILLADMHDGFLINPTDLKDGK